MATPEDLLAFLPGTDCGQCGLTCAGFADLLLSRDLSPEDCPVLYEENYAGCIEALHEILGSREAAPAAGMRVDPEKCNGCGICVAMCEFHLGNCDEARLGRGPRLEDQARLVFRIVNGTVEVIHQELCTRLVQAAEKCNKCGEHCPTEAITLY
jgi:Na+-translocating ferredoxin:NAD+ oxidoreductase RNF subunit RnfB